MFSLCRDQPVLSASPLMTKYPGLHTLCTRSFMHLLLCGDRRQGVCSAEHFLGDLKPRQTTQEFNGDYYCLSCNRSLAFEIGIKWEKVLQQLISDIWFTLWPCLPSLLFSELRKSRESEARSPHAMQLYPRQHQVSTASKLVLPDIHLLLSLPNSCYICLNTGSPSIVGMPCSLWVPQDGLKTAPACTEIALHSCNRKGRGGHLWSQASLRMFLQISSRGEYSAKTFHVTGKGFWTLGTSFLLLVEECVGSWPDWIKGFLIKGSLAVP